MKVALISAYPPSKVTLNEYGYYLANALAQKEEIQELYLLADKLDDGLQYQIPESIKKIKTVPSWKFDSLTNFLSLTRAVRKHKPDVVLINMQFLQFGGSKIPAAMAMLTPMILRALGYKVVILLHNIVEMVDYKEAGITDSKILTGLFDAIGTGLTRLLLRSHLLLLTISDYVHLFRKKYKTDKVALMPHGAFETPPLPDFTRKSSDKTRLMTFGKFGTYKKVEILIEAGIILREKYNIETEIVIAGTDNPNVPGYLESVKEKYKNLDNLDFTGYVEESDVPQIFGDSDIVIFPYSSTTGSSGVLHQASSYGKASVLPAVHDLARLIEEEGYTGEFFTPEDPESLAEAIRELIIDDDKRINIARQNYYAATSIPMEDIAEWYLLHFKKLLGDI